MPSTFTSQAKEAAAVRADTEDMKRFLARGTLFATTIAERTGLSHAALSMRSLWNARAKKQSRSKQTGGPPATASNDEGAPSID